MIRARSDQGPCIFSFRRSPLSMMNAPKTMSIPPRTIGKYPGPMLNVVPNG